MIHGKLYEIEGYPGVVASDNPDDVVHGDLYRIVNGEKLLPQLDEYEECTDRFPQPHEYVRKKVRVSVAGGRSVSAWGYIFNRDVTDLVPIEGGDYCRYMNGGKGEKA